MQSIQREMVSLVPKLRRYARGLTNNADQADDLVQDSLSRALVKLHLWQPDTNLRAWIFTIMHNVFVNDCRKNKKWLSSVPLDEAEEISDTGAEPDQTLYSNQIMQFISTLPAHHKEVLLLVAVEGLAYAEVAEILDLPIGTVMSRLHRARESLRNKMSGQDKPLIRSVK